MAQKSYYWNGTDTPYVGASWRGYAYPAVQHAKEVSDDMMNHNAVVPQGVTLEGPKVDIPIWMWLAGAAAGYYYLVHKPKMRTNPRRRRRRK